MTALLGDPFFWYGLALKIAMTASIVVAASIIVERSGPFVGSLDCLVADRRAALP